MTGSQQRNVEGGLNPLGTRSTHAREGAGEVFVDPSGMVPEQEMGLQATSSAISHIPPASIPINEASTLLPMAQVPVAQAAVSESQQGSGTDCRSHCSEAQEVCPRGRVRALLSQYARQGGS